MQDVSIFWLRVAALLYLPGLVDATLTVLRRKPTFFRPALTLFAVAALVHLVSLVDLARQTGRFPAETFYESISLCGFLVAVSFLALFWRYKFVSLSLIVFPLVFLMTLIGATSTPVATWTNPRVRDAWLLLHVTLAISGYAALLTAVSVSFFYLVQERRLKAKRFTSKLPPLATLDDILSRSMGWGFVLITLAVLMGSIWGFIESGTAWVSDPKIVVAWATWLGYLVMVFLRVSAGWRGRKAAVMALSVLGFSVLTWAAHVGIRESLLR
jgi:ABC-type uncharacterized transport system permease subunit